MKFSCLCVISPFPSENCKCHMLPTTMAVRNSSYYKFNEEHVEKKSSGIRNFLKVCGFTDLRSNCNLAFISWAFKDMYKKNHTLQNWNTHPHEWTPGTQSSNCNSGCSMKRCLLHTFTLCAVHFL